MPNEISAPARKAAEEIAEKYLSEPCREVDDDGKVCAWSIDSDVMDGIAAIIARHYEAEAIKADCSNFALLGALIEKGCMDKAAVGGQITKWIGVYEEHIKGDAP